MNILKQVIPFIPETELVSKIEDIKSAIDNLTNTIKDTPTSVGMAGPQLDISLPLFVMKYKGEIINCINPVIESQSNTGIRSEEGCLSFPGYFCNITRMNDIKTSYHKINKDGELKKDSKTFRGHEACIFQHELDHLFGITIFDRANTLVTPAKGYKALYKLISEEDFILDGEKETLFKKLPYDGDYKLPIIAYYNESTSK